MEKIKSGKVLRIALAILVAVAVWLYVDSVKAPDVRVKANHIPVEFSGENDTLADKGLMIISGYDTTIDLTLKGPRKVLWKLDKSEIRIVVDTSGINDTGVKTLRYNVVYPDAVSGSQIKVENASAFTVTVTVGELSTKEVPIECKVIGEPAAGFIVGELSLDPDVLMLRASRDELVNVSHAKVQIDISGANKTVVQAVGYELYDYNDILIENTGIRANVKLVQVTMPVLMHKTVPLKLDFVEAPGSTMAQVQYQIQPEQVVLTGQKDLLEGIDEKGEITPEAESMVMNDLRAHFRPEFLNRLDETILFKPLTKSDVRSIINLLLADLNKRLADKELHLELTEEAKDYITDQGYDPVYGARPLKRYVQKYVETLTARIILQGDVSSGDTIVITAGEGGLSASVR